ncbi:hypothetical protein AF331_16920 [Rossellomorea marisflavi]|uniref:ABC transporter domain-containing protein n=1 Tax=Rossellomorea marisflavi TaxID=189381 RepID=A0A0M0G200_9BACI|nr:ABC transporter ATP-binding protein [Rossellomorea marisflavi]KON83839.1 hypothetical protein AF331_16920 [Rossellomorea marisflavi]
MSALLTAVNISKKYKHHQVLRGISFSLYSNQIVMLRGDNGAGKSTLLKLVAGMSKVDDGTIYHDVMPLTISYVPEITPGSIPFTPVEYLTHMGKIRGMEDGLLQMRITRLLEDFRLESVKNQRISTFSKGMKQKVLIMQAMLEEPHLLIMDEPLSGLDARAQQELEELFGQLKGTGVGIVFTCHESRRLSRLADQIFVIKDKGLVKEERLLRGKFRIVFDIHSTKLDHVTPLLEMKKSLELTDDRLRMEAMLGEDELDGVLLALLQRGASIKEVGAYPSMIMEKGGVRS